MSLEEVREDVMNDDDGKWDLYVQRSALTMSEGNIVIPETQAAVVLTNADSLGFSFPDGRCPTTLRPTLWGTTQFCQRLGIPTAYFKRCPLHLCDAQFNYWVQYPANGNGPKHHSEATNGNGNSNGESEVWLLRLKEDLLRGVLSDQYTRLDNWELLDTLYPQVKDRFEVQWWELTDESFHLRLTISDLRRDILPGDPVMAGVHVANSEVGKRAVTVDALIYRVICTNGMIRLIDGKSLLHQRHIHVSIGRLSDELGQAVSQAASTALEFMERLRQTTQEPIADVETTLKRLGNQHNLSQDFQESVQRALLNERSSQQETVYGLANALTNAAHRMPADDRYDIEVLAGQLIESGIRSTRRSLTGEVMMDASDQGFNGPNGNGQRQTTRPVPTVH